MIDELTNRELEVLALLSKRALNTEIASTLSISMNTVKSYITHILNKLQARDRVHAVSIFLAQPYPLKIYCSKCDKNINKADWFSHWELCSGNKPWPHLLRETPKPKRQRIQPTTW